MKKSRFTDSQIMDALKRVEAGLAVKEIGRELGISTPTFYKWREKYGGMDVALLTRLKEREAGKCPAQEDVCRRATQGGYPPGGPPNKLTRPSRRREMAQELVKAKGVSIRLSCWIFGISEHCYRCCSKRKDDNILIADWLMRLTDHRRHWGFGLCFLYWWNVQRLPFNHKRVYRIYRELELNLRIKPRRRLKRTAPEPLAIPKSINHVWSMLPVVKCH